MEGQQANQISGRIGFQRAEEASLLSCLSVNIPYHAGTDGTKKGKRYRTYRILGILDASTSLLVRLVLEWKSGNFRAVTKLER